jgi:hypothetical protein
MDELPSRQQANEFHFNSFDNHKNLRKTSTISPVVLRDYKAKDYSKLSEILLGKSLNNDNSTPSINTGHVNSNMQSQ